jgi:hypothetical protein
MNESFEDKVINILLSKYPIYEQVSFDEINLAEKYQANPYLLIQYKDLYNKEKMQLDELEDELEETIGTLYHKYRFEYDEELTNKEIEKYYIPKDKEIKLIKKKIRLINIKLRFFDMCIKGLERQHWSMREFKRN